MAALHTGCTSGCRHSAPATALARPASLPRTAFAGQRLARGQVQQSALLAAAAPARQQRRMASVPRAAAAAAPAVTPLEDIEFFAVVNTQGYVSPTIPEGTEATVFAVYDDSRTLQYIGFSRGLRDSLRTLFSRRPEKTHYFKALHLPELDQQQMLAVRSAWFDANLGPPPGNKLPAERDQWQQPVEAHTISERGKTQAAVELAKQLQLRIKQRGCKEEFVTNAELLPQGRVDFLPAEALTEEELERQRLLAIEAAKASRTVSFELEGKPASFDLFYKNTLKTNGGFMFDVSVTFQDKETHHRVIVGRDYFEPQGITPEATLERTFAFLLRKKVPRQTEGLLLNSQFSANYFSISQVEQNFDEFASEFAELGKLPGADGFWRFNRTQDYGFKGGNETAAQLQANFTNS